jgi:hypothetical protein
MTADRAPAPGDLLADRYRLREPLGGGGSCQRFRADDERLHRAVVVEVACDRATTGEVPATSVRALTGADDTGLHEVLDGGTVAGRSFVVRELRGSGFDETAAIDVGPRTAVMAVPPAALPLEHELTTPPPARRRPAGPWFLAAAAAAALLLALVLASWAGGGKADSGPTTTTSTTATTAPAVAPPRKSPATTATTAPPTTTTAAPTTTELVVPTTSADFPFDSTEAPPG